jgi:putative transposase
MFVERAPGGLFMPRRRRIAVANYPHHIVQRGHSRRRVFFGSHDHESYLTMLQKSRRELGLKIYGYCLMSNHVHLIVDPGSDASSLSHLMKRLAGRHTQRMNRLRRRSGTLWEGRFKCSPIESDRYLLACARYVDLNPVRAGIVSAPEEYQWSSYRARIGLTACDWLDPDPCFLALAATAERRRQKYRRFVEDGVLETELKFIRDCAQRNQLTGCASFVDEIERRTGARIANRRPGRPPGSRTNAKR